MFCSPPGTVYGSLPPVGSFLPDAQSIFQHARNHIVLRGENSRELAHHLSQLDPQARPVIDVKGGVCGPLSKAFACVENGIFVCDGLYCIEGPASRLYQDSGNVWTVAHRLGDCAYFNFLPEKLKAKS